MILAISNIAWNPEERHAVYAMMSEAGVTGLEIAPSKLFFASPDPFRPDPRETRDLLAEIASAGLRLISMQSLLFGLEGAALFGDAEARKRFRAGMDRAIELAGRLGIPNIVFGSPGQRRIPDDMAPESAREAAVDTFGLLADKAAAAGTVIAMEANPAAYGTNFLTTLDEALVFVAALGHPAVKVVLDLGAMTMNNEAASIPARVPGLASRLNHVHASEPFLAPAPADGAALTSVFVALAAAGYAGAVSIEMKRPESGLVVLRRSLAALRAAAAAGGVA